MLQECINLDITNETMQPSQGNKESEMFVKNRDSNL